jgi:signal transduction histidine kinase/CheY-like chemotaxis protein
MHHLLSRQVKKSFNSDPPSSPEFEAFLEVVSNAYDNYDKDHNFLEHSFDISSKEFQELNNKVLQLVEEIKIEKQSVEQKVVERTAELKAANKRLVALDKAKTEFISVAAHELRTPLTAIKWIVQLLHKDAATNLKPEQAKQVVTLNEIINKMVSLVGDILNVSQIEEGRFGAKLKEQGILPLLQNVLSTIEVNAQAKNIKLIKNIPPTLPALPVDEERFKLALGNIISNAVKYTPANGQVSVVAAATADNLTITIMDTGIGIVPADQKRLFDKFFRANNALKHDTEGIGLGLFIAHNIIAAHHGQITFHSELNKGTTFIITFPLVKKTINNMATQPKKILLIEDDKFLHEILDNAIIQTIGKDNVTVEVAVTGSQAIDKLNELKDKLNLILLDIVLPDKNGFEILEYLKQDQTLHSIPVIVLSNLGQPEEIAKAKALGARDFMIKAQSDTSEIMAKVRTYLG